MTPGERLTSISCATDFENALYLAAQLSEPGDIVLLSQAVPVTIHFGL